MPDGRPAHPALSPGLKLAPVNFNLALTEPQAPVGHGTYWHTLALFQPPRARRALVETHQSKGKGVLGLNSL